MRLKERWYHSIPLELTTIFFAITVNPSTTGFRFNLNPSNT